MADILPAGVLNVVTGYGPVVGTRLAEHPDVAMIALTGSVGSGQAVARAAAESLKRVHLELGGKAPVVIFHDADLAAAATALRAAGYWNSGQECGAGCRVLVHESVADEFTELLVDEVATIVVGEPGAGDDVEIGPMISKAHFERVTGYLERAEAAGHPRRHRRHGAGGRRLLRRTHGAGRRAGRRGVRPRGDLRPGRHRRDLHRRRTRPSPAPTPCPTACPPRSGPTDARRSHDVAAKLDAGTVWVNAHLVLANEVPWGGFKGSGYGRDLSIYALDDYSRTKHVMHNVGADRSGPDRSPAGGEDRRTHLLGEPAEVLFGGHPRGERVPADDGLDDRALAADVLVPRQLLAAGRSSRCAGPGWRTG